jgi:hypothetical protein
VLTTSSSAIGLPFGDQVAPTEAHLEFMDGHRKSAYDAHHRAEAFILPQLGDIEVSALTTERIRKWHIALAQAPARMRSPKNGKQRYRQLGKDADSIRRRQASANRNLTQLKAALNAAWRDGRTPSDAAWRRVRPFPGADAVFDARGMPPPDQFRSSGGWYRLRLQPEPDMASFAASKPAISTPTLARSPSRSARPAGRDASF